MINSFIPKIPTIHRYSYLTSMEKEVLNLVNIERQNRVISVLSWDESIHTIARYKANEMLQYNYFAHKSIYTGHPYDLARTFYNYKFNFFGENIQMGMGYDISQITAEFLVVSWMNSKEHRANILNKNYTNMSTGIAYSDSSKLFYCSQMFSG